MSEALEVRAELEKLARLLQVDDGELDYLSPVGADTLRKLREQITEVLFDVDAANLHHLAALGRALPPRLIAAITKEAVSPLLSARIAGFVETRQAVQVARRLPAPFLADVAVELDPRRVSDVIAGVPRSTVVEVTEELAKRGEYVAMGRFVGHMDNDAIAAGFDVIDDVCMMQTAFVLEDKRRLDAVTRLLPDERLAGILHAAADEDLWPEALDLVNNLGEKQLRRVAAIAADQDDDLLDSLVEAAQKEDLWESVLPLIGKMDPERRARLARLPSAQKKAVLSSVVDAAARHRLWSELIPLFTVLPKRSRHIAAAQAGILAPDLLDAALADANKHKLWPGIVAIAGDMADPEPIFAALMRASSRVLENLVKAATKDDLWDDLRTVLEHLPSKQRKHLRTRAVELGIIDRLAPVADLLK